MSVTKYEKIVINSIEELNSQNINAALVLFKKYQEFYQVQNIDEEKNHQHLQMILENEEIGKLFLIRAQDTYAGFATIYYSFSSILAEKIAILNDIYVEENHRRKGFGKQLMEHCFSYLKTGEINTVRWMTDRDNEVAQRVYNHYTTGANCLMYSYKIP